jgi:hypothetical protein
MSLYNRNSLTDQIYEMVNPTNSDPAPFTATGGDSDAVFRGPHAATNPQNPMKGGYTYKKYNKKSRPTRRSKKSSKPSITSLTGLDISYRGKAGRSRRKQMSRHMGMTLARGYSGGRRRSRRHRRKMRGGIMEFPVGYALGGELNHNLSALANPPVYTPYYK